jgi:hypothetical protein
MRLRLRRSFGSPHNGFKLAARANKRTRQIQHDKKNGLSRNSRPYAEVGGVRDARHTYRHELSSWSTRQTPWWIGLWRAARSRGGIWRRHRDRRNRRRNLERGSRDPRARRKLDYLGLLRRAQDNHRRHRSDLEAREHEELLSLLTTCGRMEHRVEGHFSIASIRGGQAHRGKDVPAG